MSKMSIKLKIFLVACIICTFALNVAIGRPDITISKLSPDEKSGLDSNGTDYERAKRQSDYCGWSGGCYKGYCWANCQGGIGTLGISFFSFGQIFSISKSELF